MKILNNILCGISILSLVGCGSITFVKPTPEQLRNEAKATARTGTYFALKNIYKKDSVGLKETATSLKNYVDSIDWTKPVNSQSVSTFVASHFHGDEAILFQFAIDLVSAHVDTTSPIVLTGDNLLFVQSVFSGISEGCTLIVTS